MTTDGEGVVSENTVDGNAAAMPTAGFGTSSNARGSVHSLFTAAVHSCNDVALINGG